MYHSEKTINNVLYYRNRPNGPWTEFTSAMLNERIEELEYRLLLSKEFNQGGSK
jgi:hypothetical protein